MHRKKWAYVAESAFKEAKEALGIGEVDDLDKLVRIRMYLNDGTPCPSKIVEEPGRVTMTVLACPLIQIAREVFGEGRTQRGYRQLPPLRSGSMRRWPS